MDRTCVSRASDSDSDSNRARAPLEGTRWWEKMGIPRAPAVA
ncbi:nonribosomal peptide synthase [Aspergillus luchuensis]|uniref:Nonribosomal peptide synthase n=1 Tax=Aspergillus kawachii TaxID=1069201 RepID=A0A146FWY5_ASPKA|nr:nonribosomal peptide synthase [Aspergillus luchuensis]